MVVLPLPIDSLKLLSLSLFPFYCFFYSPSHLPRSPSLYLHYLLFPSPCKLCITLMGLEFLLCILRHCTRKFKKLVQTSRQSAFVPGNLITRLLVQNSWHVLTRHDFNQHHHHHHLILLLLVLLLLQWWWRQ